MHGAPGGDPRTGPRRFLLPRITAHFIVRDRETFEGLLPMTTTLRKSAAIPAWARPGRDPSRALARLSDTR